MYGFWIILTGSLVAVSCSILGCYLILRKMAMIGDAISHAVLPGIVIAYFIADSRSSVIMLLGAALFGVLTTFIIEFFYKKARMQPDASIGITFTWLFAIGVILVTAFAENVDIDQECVLYGEIGLIPFDRLLIKGNDLGPVAVWLLGANFLLILLGLKLGYRGLFITSFDEAYAAGIGIATGFWQYALMSSVSLTTVLSFESVGAILVVAFLVVPPAAAYLLTQSLRHMLYLSAAFGVLSAIGGYLTAVYIDNSISASMAVISGIIFSICFLISLGKRKLQRKSYAIETDKYSLSKERI